jgi:hypothetical protein
VKGRSWDDLRRMANNKSPMEIWWRYGNYDDVLSRHKYSYIYF